jgi:hypothetical protein
VWHTATFVSDETARASSYLRDLLLSFLRFTSNTGTQMGNYAPSLFVQLAKSKDTMYSTRQNIQILNPSVDWKCLYECILKNSEIHCSLRQTLLNIFRRSITRKCYKVLHSNVSKKPQDAEVSNVSWLFGAVLGSLHGAFFVHFSIFRVIIKPIEGTGGNCTTPSGDCHTADISLWIWSVFDRASSM